MRWGGDSDFSNARRMACSIFYLGIGFGICLNEVDERTLHRASDLEGLGQRRIPCPNNPCLISY